MARIVLAHGILGFGTVFPSDPITYFNGIAELYNEGGANEVFCPTVLGLGSLDARARELTRQVQARWPDRQGPLFLLAHSMGGLDCRRMLARNPDIAARVKRLVTIATPHFGSPVADKLLHPTFFGAPSLTSLLTLLSPDLFGALDDLTTRHVLQDPSVTDANTLGGVDYKCIGCCPSTLPPGSFLFSRTAGLGEFGSTPNDGVVSLASASPNNDGILWNTWEVDHGGAIGWPSGTRQELAYALANPAPAHLKRYRDLLPQLLH